MAGQSTYTSDSKVGGTQAETIKRQRQAKDNAKSATDLAVQEGMNKDLGAVARANAAKRAGKPLGGTLTKGGVDFGNLGRVAPGGKRSMGGGR